jgi:hypothetical protein
MTDIAVRGRPFRLAYLETPMAGRLGTMRHQFSNAFMDDLTATWAEYGLSAMQRTARENPQSFFMRNSRRSGRTPSGAQSAAASSLGRGP